MTSVAGGDDPYFGFDLSSIGAGVGATGYYTTDGPPAVCKNYDFAGLNIETLYQQIVKGEQPGTTAERGQQWLNVALMLQTAADDLHDQTQTLAGNWKSPGAKEVFLGKVGMTLGYLRQWEDAALANGTALWGLSNVMYEAQAEMEHLYQEYRSAKGDAVQNATHDMGAFYEAKVGTMPGTDQDKAKAAQEVESKYDQQARDLAEKIAGEYAPYIYKLQAAHSPKPEVLNAILHPEATGAPRPPDPPAVNAPGAPPGGAPGTPPGTPGGAPNAPGNPPNAPTAPGNPPNAPGDAPTSNSTNTPTAPPTPGPAPTAPGAPAPTPPGAPVSPPGDAPTVNPALLGLAAGAAPGLIPGAFNGGKAPAAPSSGGPGNLFAGNKMPTGVPPTLGLTTTSTPPGTVPGAAPPPVNQNSLYPPGTISPPPGGHLPEQAQGKEPGGNRPGAPSFNTSLPFDEHLDLEAKAAYHQDARSAPPLPPGGQPATGRDVQQAGTKPGAPSMGEATERAPAFQPPPSTTPPVLNNDRRTSRGGSRQEAPSGTHAGLPPGVGAPPVLSNPHRKAPAKTFSEWKAERKRRKPQPEAGRGSEFAANLPPSTASVFDGRISAEEYVVGSAGEIPSVLTPLTPAPDRHAKPVVHADRAKRVAKPAEQAPAGEQTAFEVDTPGGPVVAATEPEKRYRPAEPSPLDGRS